MDVDFNESRFGGLFCFAFFSGRMGGSPLWAGCWWVHLKPLHTWYLCSEGAQLWLFLFLQARICGEMLKFFLIFPFIWLFNIAQKILYVSLLLLKVAQNCWYTCWMKWNHRKDICFVQGIHQEFLPFPVILCLQFCKVCILP